jgi:hypothetical protein
LLSDKWSARSLVLADYPGALAEKFLSNSTLWPEGVEDADVTRAVSAARVIHVHNTLPPRVCEAILRLAPAATYIYQVHSPLREGPLFTPQDREIGLPFRLRLVVGQYQPRQYPSFIPVPNVIFRAPSENPIRAGERPRVLFCPTHSRGGRWNAKLCPKLDRALEDLERLRVIARVVPGIPLHPDDLFALRRGCHISVDEIVTGAFHQVSLEGLATGNATLNGADFFSRVIFAETVGATEEPPFIHAEPDSVESILLSLARDTDRLREIQAASSRYFAEYLAPEVLASRVCRLYEEALLQ